MDEEKKEIGFNTKCELFKQQIITDINNSQLPIAVIYYITKNVFQEIETTYYGTLNSEAQVQTREVSETIPMEDSNG